jgi:hypothetical protein
LFGAIEEDPRRPASSDNSLSAAHNNAESRT